MFGLELVRRIGCDRMRALCIKHNWYNAGTNEEYGHLLLDLCQHKPNLTDDDITEIVLDIIAHTAEFRNEQDPEVWESNLFNVSEAVLKELTQYLRRDGS